VVAALAFVSALAASELHGRSSRTYLAGAGPSDPAVVVVADAGEALRAWRAAGVRGRDLVVLSGQWARPAGIRTAPPATLAELAAAEREEPEPVDGTAGLYLAAREGIARRLDVVLTPAALARRLEEVAGQKGVATSEDGEAYTPPFIGVERRFSTARAFEPPAEPALVLVEPSWFDGAPPGDPLAWLRSRGVTFDLAIVALEDPAASEAARGMAAELARRLGARAPVRAGR
jgi:hypothetical protein